MFMESVCLTLNMKWKFVVQIGPKKQILVLHQILVYVLIFK